MNKSDTTPAKGLVHALLAFSLWGIMPIYWKFVKAIPSDEVVATRAILFFVVVYGILIYKKQIFKIKETLADKKTFILGIFAAILVATNWFLFVWAVNSDNIVQVSLGYYMTPLMVILLGMFILKEKLNGWQKISLILATLGVLILTVSYGKVPWIALSLALAFALYGLVKKLINVESIVGLGIETLFLLPIATGYMVFKSSQSAGMLLTFSHSTAWILIFAGIATFGPLYFFASAAKQIQLSTLGFLQYIYPTTSLLIGIFIYNEQFTRTHFISFGFIWVGLLLYSLSQTQVLKKEQIEEIA